MSHSYILRRDFYGYNCIRDDHRNVCTRSSYQNEGRGAEEKGFFENLGCVREENTREMMTKNNDFWLKSRKESCNTEP